MSGQVMRHPEWRLIVDALSARDYGTEITHAEMSAITGLAYPSVRYFQQVTKAKRRLLSEWSREMETLSGQGYRLVKPDEFHARARRQVVFAGRRLRRGASVLVAAPQHLLTDEQNSRNANALAKIGALEAQRKRVIAETRPVLPPARHDTPKLLSV